MSKKISFLFIGSSGFPFGMAAIQRQLQIAKAMKTDYSRVVIVNRKGVHSPDIIKKENIKIKGTFEGIDYVYTSGTAVYSKIFLLRNFLKIIGVLGELYVICFNRLFCNLKCLVINSLSLRELKYYYVISRIIRAKLIYDYVEFMSSLEDRSMKAPLQKTTFDDLFFNYTDLLIVISPFLENHVRKVCPGKPYIVIPPIMDFEKFSAITTKSIDSNYFLYCGSTHYMDVVEFVIDAYRKSKSYDYNVRLILVINGDSKSLSTLKRTIHNEKGIEVVSNLSYQTLIGYYKNAKSLLIPLQNNLQDKARFPFKISEYTAAARPIITSDSGAVVHYFKDGRDALLAKTGDANDFASKLNFILNNPEKAEQIAKNGYDLGLKHFNFKTYSDPLMILISNLH